MNFRSAVSCFFVLTFCLNAATLTAQSSADAFKNLATAARKEASSRPAANSGTPVPRIEPGLAMLGQIELALARHDSTRIEEMLVQLSNYFTSEEVQQDILKLTEVLSKERDARNEAVVNDLTAALKQSATAVATAKRPEDLDEPLKNLSRFRNFTMQPGMTEKDRALQSRVEPVLNFLRHWQEYLSAVQEKNVRRARESLSRLSDTDVPEIMPRSQLLTELEKYPDPERQKAEAPSVAQIDEVVAKAKTLDDVRNVLAELRHLQSGSHSYSGSDPLTATINALVPIERSYQEFKSGLPTRLDLSPSSSSEPASDKVVALKAKLELAVLPRYLGAPPDLQPNQNESVDAYLNRIVAAGRSRSDGPLVTRARDAQKSFMSGFYTASAETPGVQSYAAAQNQEAAGQYMLAVVSYQTALKTGGDLVPAKLIGERLSAIKTAHPQEYEEGMKQFLTPPAPVMPMGFARPFPEGSRPPNIPIPPISPTPLARPVPATSPVASPSAN